MFFSGLWAVVNNAGVYAFGDIEWCTIRQFRTCMDVNFFGAIRVIKAFVHLVRESKGASGKHPKFLFIISDLYRVIKYFAEVHTDIAQSFDPCYHSSKLIKNDKYHNELL